MNAKDNRLEIQTVDSEGSTKYYLNNQLHRVDGPAVIYVHGTEEWYINGQPHRENGPAVVIANGILMVLDIVMKMNIKIN